MGKLGGNVLDPDLTLKIRRMKGLRNVLVQGYSQINDQRVYEILSSDLNDIIEFKEEIIKFLGEI
ncbi:MAG: DUF86 domain-containing protein [Methanobacteriaceae archaeon]|nr:DUF86 domain-containing protein [Methanobacteriaceae archaeon]